MKPTFFSPDHLTARERFQAAANKVQGDLHFLPLSASGRNSDALGLDIAWLGSRQPQRALLHVCGIHGVEGFAGSAVQLALLDKLPPLPADTALILVHVLNPYGMAHLRRGNENNVDLNRNFFFGTSGWHGAPDGYATLDRFLNPPYPPARLTSFHVRLLLAELSLGGSAIRQAVAGGQYDFPKGIFYGGSALEEGPKLFGAWLGAHLLTARELFVIDVHTGLGSYGQQSLFLRSDTDAAGLSEGLGLQLTTDNRESDVMGYEHEGGHSSIYRQLLPEARTVCITQEFGTYNGRRLLRALRAENQYHHYGDGQLDHWSKRKLKAMFCPEDDSWRGQVVTQGCDLVARAGKFLASGRITLQPVPSP
jgi:hypothetical protein